MYYKKSIGALAQLVARNVRNVEVTGSNPVCSTRYKKSESQALRQKIRIFCCGGTGIPIGTDPVLHMNIPVRIRIDRLQTGFRQPNHPCRDLFQKHPVVCHGNDAAGTA